MASQNDVTIGLNARNNAGPAIKQVQSELNGLGRAASGAGQGLAGLGGALAGGALFGAALSGVQALGSAVLGLAEGAARLETLRGSFDRLAGGVGQSSAQMLDALRSASAGMISDQDLLLAANKAMLLGVADSAEEMTALMQIAMQRGAAMGLSTSQAFNDIVTGLGRGSALIFDNLGIVIDAEKTNAEYAAGIGKTAAALTEQEKKQALVNSVMREAASISGDAASSMSENARAIGSMGAAWQNLKDQLGTLVSPAVATAMQGLADALRGVNAEIVKTSADRRTERSVAYVDQLRAEIAALDEVAAADKARGGTPQERRDVGLEIINEQIAAEERRYQAVEAGAELEVTAIREATAAQQLYRDTLAATGSEAAALAAVKRAELNAYLEAIEATRTATAAYREGERAQTQMSTAAQALSAAHNAEAIAAAEAAARAGDLQAALGIAESGMNSAGGAARQLTGDLSVMAGVAASAGVDLANLGAAADAVMQRVNAAVGNLPALRQSAISAVQTRAEALVDKGLLSADDAVAIVGETADAMWNLNIAADATVEGQMRAKQALEETGRGAYYLFDSLEAADAEAKKFAAEGMAAAKKAAADAAAEIEKSYNKILGATQSVLQAGLDPSVGDEWEKALPREDAVNENARRLAAIATEGLKDQSWLEEFKSEVPDIFALIANASDPKGMAASILADFQDGLKPELLDKEKAKDLIRQALTGEANMAALAQEIAGELSAEMGISLGAAQAAAFSTLGVAKTEGGTTGVGEGAAAELSSEATLKSMAKAGAEAAMTWGTAFLDKVAEGVPAALVEMLTALVTPQVQAKLQAAQTQTGAQ